MKHRDGRPEDSIQFSVTAGKKLIKKFKRHCLDNDVIVYRAFETAIGLYLKEAALEQKASKQSTAREPDLSTAFQKAADALK